MHISCVRGSPLIRTFLVLGLLCISALGFVKLTGSGGKTVEAGVVEAPKRNPNAPIEVIPAKVRVILSDRAKSVKLFAGAGYYQFGENADGDYSGELKIAKEGLLLEIQVDWLDESATRRFAKLVVEAEGQETFTHVFDAQGDVDDFVELPF
ncbi:MAG: hypothetical protein ABJQ29_08010 [Luteolibacter sp.]